MNVIAFPAVVDVEFSGQVASQFVRRCLCLLAGQAVVGMKIDVRHETAGAAQSDISLDGRPVAHQYPSTGPAS